ncbi:MAG TPA: hypothetical protein VML54_05195 [Candidatus Limnocylindrales bacterium]|nr:hypothetical protein [Candidatus Limnocylindrales bacterium]
MSRLSLAATALALCAALGCANPFGGRGEPGPRPDPSYGVQEVEAEGIVAFYERASSFYGRLALRRFNSLGTYRDETLREFFRTHSAFSDYYADLAQALAEAHFERNRPLTLDVVEMRLSGPGEAEVVTRIVGDHGLPLRWWSTRLERVDRWERIQGQWWVVPSKL